jgi:hypothetical protein
MKVSDSSKLSTTTGGVLGTGLIVLGGVLGALIGLWLLVSLLGGGLRAGGAVLGLMLLAVLCVPMIWGGWYLRSWGRQEIAEANTYAARREVLDTDVLIRRQLVREIEQRLTGIERLLPALPPARAPSVEGALRRLREVRGSLLRPGYDATRWLNTGGGLDERQLATVRRYDDLVLGEAKQLAQIEGQLTSDPGVSDRLVHAVDILAEHVSEREQLFGRGREASSLRPQELLAAGRSMRRHLSSPLALSLNDAVSHEGSDYLVRAALTYFAGGRQWKSYQLHDGKQERWLEVRDTGADLRWLAPPAALPGEIDGSMDAVEVDGIRYTAGETGTATVTIDSAAGHQEGVFVQYRRYEANGRTLIVERWPDGQRMIDGRSIQPDELDLWTRPPASE